MRKHSVRIGCAAGFWGDTESAALELVTSAELDYLVFDYLAEITLGIMAGARLKRPDAGYAHDFVTRVMSRCLLPALERKVRIISSAGGLNPLACREALREVARTQGVSPRIAVVLGDDLLPRAHALGAELRDVSGAPMPNTLISLNVYLGAEGIAAALAEGADIVITGRVTDSALVLAPLMHEHGWGADDFDQLARGSLAGHIIECGAQATGGLFTDWESVTGYEHMGFPVVECEADGTFVLGKPAGSGGLVNPAVVFEQLVYEIGDPRAYVLPDVVCDFTEVRAEAVSADRVRVSGAKGRPPPQRYKAVGTYPNGFKAVAAMLLGGRDAARKAERVGSALLAKTSTLFAARGFAPYTETLVEALGAEASYGANARPEARATREVVLRIAAAHEQKEALELMLRELPHAGTGMAPGLASSVSGRAAPMPRVGLFTCLVDRERVACEIDVDGARRALSLHAPARFDSGPTSEQDRHFEVSGCDARVPLIALAYGRSGDKGDAANIGIIARQPEFVPYIGGALSADVVRQHLAHLLDPERGRVTRYFLPAAGAFNFLLTAALGGGGMWSLRSDPQGKAFAQQLLSFEVPVPSEIAARLQGPEVG
ncbi:MAG TPA: acyclic terpene utilization AtuA family protein [Polyangiales bacterium]|nr:acyclic terpene utilization AtuA family protein [Polyangiales bacterium]